MRTVTNLNRFFSIEIKYTMPLRKDLKRYSDGADSGCVTSDLSQSSATTVVNNTEEQNLKDDDDDDEDEPQDEWLQSLGVESSEIRKINSSKVIL